MQCGNSLDKSAPLDGYKDWIGAQVPTNWYDNLDALADSSGSSYVKGTVVGSTTEVLLGTFTYSVSAAQAIANKSTTIKAMNQTNSISAVDAVYLSGVLKTSKGGDANFTSTYNVPLNISIQGATTTATTYQLTVGTTAARILQGQTATINGDVKNTGTGTADTLDASLTSGTAGMGPFSRVSGTPLAQGATGSATATYTGTGTGNQTITVGGTFTNATIGGAATGNAPQDVIVGVVTNRGVTQPTRVDFGRVYGGTQASSGCPSRSKAMAYTRSPPI